MVICGFIFDNKLNIWQLDIQIHKLLQDRLIWVRARFIIVYRLKKIGKFEAAMRGF